MEYMVRFMQTHESFRLAEIQALATLENIDLKIVSYDPTSPYCYVQLPSEAAARLLVKRSILARGIYEVWGRGKSYDETFKNVTEKSKHLWPQYKTTSFKFSVDSFQGSRTTAEQRDLINSFRFLEFEGPIRMKNAEQDFWICENWRLDAPTFEGPKEVCLARWLANGTRDVVAKYDLKKRKYICTTSMDAELALITANITLASAGKLFYDPFVGSGSFTVACAHFGALAFGSDIDGRSIRGKGKVNVLANFEQYKILDNFGDNFVADLTNTPLRNTRMFDGILCDPPYGVREGLKVLGSRDLTKGKEIVYKYGIAHHMEDHYIPPKRPYSFLAMLDDILDFAVLTLVDNARLSFWMPTANEADQEIKIPTHPSLELVSVCTQVFNRWSRRLITYRRIPDEDVVESAPRAERAKESGISADDLNPFRKGYFKGFKAAFREEDTKS